MAQKSYIVKSILLSLGMSAVALADKPTDKKAESEVWYNAKGEAIIVRGQDTGKPTKEQDKVPTHLVRKGAITEDANTVRWAGYKRHRGQSHYYVPRYSSGYGYGYGIYAPYRNGYIRYHRNGHYGNGFSGGYSNGKWRLNYRSGNFSIQGRF